MAIYLDEINCFCTDLNDLGKEMGGSIEMFLFIHQKKHDNMKNYAINDIAQLLERAKRENFEVHDFMEWLEDTVSTLKKENY